jgi:hypothetical protein
MRKKLNEIMKKWKSGISTEIYSQTFFLYFDYSLFHKIKFSQFHEGDGIEEEYFFMNRNISILLFHYFFFT